MAVMCLALVGSATATTCDATSIASCQSAITISASCDVYQSYINCWGSCGVNSTYCATGGAVDIWVASVNAALSPLGCTLTNPCTSSTPTPTPAVTTATQSQKIDMTLSGYTGAMKSTYECGYWNTIGTKASSSSSYCTIAGVGCSVTTNATTVNGTTTPAVTTCTSTTNTYLTGLSSVGSSYSSSRRGAGVTFSGAVLSTLLSSTALSSASQFTSTEFLTALSAAYSSAGIPYTAPTVGTIGTATQSSAGTIAPVFGLAAAALFAVINY